MPDNCLTRLRARRRARGFTLIELMVTIAVAAILAMIAVPSFQRLILSNKLTTAANAVTNAINLARLDAIKLSATTQFCGSNSNNSNNTDTLGAACAAQPTAVYALPQGSATAGMVRTTIPELIAPVQVSNAGVNAVRFSGQGFGYAPTGSPNTPYSGPAPIAIICTTQLANNNQRVINMTTGSILTTTIATGACP